MGATGDGPRPGSRGCLVSVGLGLLALAGFVVVTALLLGEDRPDDVRVAVPAGGTVEIERTGRYSVVYDADESYRESGLCEEVTDYSPGVGNSPGTTTQSLRCDPDPLAAAGGLTITAPDGELIQLERRPLTRRVAGDLPVWEFSTDQTGTFTVALPEPPLGTDEVIVHFLDDEQAGPIWQALVFWSIPLLGAAALAVGIVSLVRLASGRRPPPTPGPWGAVTGAAPTFGALPAGWHPDPAGRAEERWWDGTTWTADVRTSGQVSADPL